MNIVILGAKDVGRYCARVLSKEDNNVILVDKDPFLLELASRDLDVGTIVGEATDWQLLEELTELRPQLLLAMTDKDETNLAACAIARNLGYSQTVALVARARYLNFSRIDFGRIFHVDHFICPGLLTAEDIFKVISSPGSLLSESFAHGAVQMRTFVIPSKWKKEEKSLSDLGLPSKLKVGLISRLYGEGKEEKRRVIFPHGDDRIMPGDEVTVIGDRDVTIDAHQFFGISPQSISSAVIIGGSKIGFYLAKILEQRNISVRLVEKDYERCCELAERLPESTVLHHDGTDFEFLKSEKVDKADIFVACSGNEEINLLTAVVAKEVGCGNIVTVVSDASYVPIMKKLGINHIVSPRISVVNRVLSITKQEMVTSVISLYENQAEVMEVRISKDSKLAGIPISEIGPQLPRDFLFGVIQNRGRIMVADGNRILSPGDTVIAITHPKHLEAMQDFF